MRAPLDETHIAGCFCRACLFREGLRDTSSRMTDTRRLSALKPQARVIWRATISDASVIVEEFDGQR